MDILNSRDVDATQTTTTTTMTGYPDMALRRISEKNNPQAGVNIILDTGYKRIFGPSLMIWDLMMIAWRRT